MKIKTHDLIGPALDWAVATCEGVEFTDEQSPYLHELMHFNYATDWAQGGPIIARERMDILCLAGGDDGWQCNKYLHTEKVEAFGPTPLIAAMRCYVASKLGDEIEIPSNLHQEP